MLKLFKQYKYRVFRSLSGIIYEGRHGHKKHTIWRSNGAWCIRV